MSAGFLLDTNAVSRTAPRSGKAPAETQAFVDWMHGNSESLHLSTVTLAEIRAGVCALERKGAVARARRLGVWLEAVMVFHGRRILAFDAEAALEAGAMLDRALGAGADPGFEDAAIAATARVHGLVVVTSNARHFESLGADWMLPPA